ncbi:MAG: glycine cleavage system protein H [Bryobacteraceae bacterium]|nr:glycine cleavage system protein H [Bryobacteraceae bacterium]
MAVGLLLLTFLAFAIIDWLLSYRHAPRIAKEAVPAAPPAPFLTPAVVDGFQVPEGLRYHLGHTWLYRERKNVARVGVDEFGASLAGHIESIELPRPGTWIRQGQKAWSFVRNGETVEMVSPTEGEVTEINQELLQNPALLRNDPYGKGWLLTVHVPDEESTTRNLLPKNMVGAWMRQSVEKLYGLQPRLAGLAAADGGRPVDDLLSEVPNAEWKAIASDFFLTC